MEVCGTKRLQNYLILRSLLLFPLSIFVSVLSIFASHFPIVKSEIIPLANPHTSNSSSGLKPILCFVVATVGVVRVSTATANHRTVCT